MATVGEVKVAGYIKGVLRDLRDIGWTTSGSFIRRTIVKIGETAGQAKLLMPTGKKKAEVINRLIAAAAYFKDQWKGANGDRSGYKVAPEVYEKLKFVLDLMDIPAYILEGKLPPVKEPPAMAKVKTPPPKKEDMKEAKEKPSDAKPKDVDDAKKKPFMETTVGKVAVYGGIPALALVILGAVAAAKKR